MKIATKLVNFESSPHDLFSPAVTPIYQTSTFVQPSATGGGSYDYSRSGNPTRAVLETQLARLEGASHAYSFASGMAAIGAITRLVAAGSEILAGDDLYGGTYRLLSQILPRQDVAVKYADTSDVDAVAAAIGPQTRLLLVETPSNPLLRVSDLAALAELAHAKGILLAVDSTFLTPYLQKPLELGADLVIHSATKYLSGHSDRTAGVVATKSKELAGELAFTQNAEGTALAPFDAWLLLRGIKTLAVRLDRQQANAQRIAEYLSRHPGLTAVSYPGLADHPGHDLHCRQARGAGAVISLETGSVEASAKLVEALQLFSITVSFGSVGSLASLPCRMSHASIPPEVRRARALPEDLVRLAIGIEDVDDLLADLDQALSRVLKPDVCQRSAPMIAQVGVREE